MACGPGEATLRARVPQPKCHTCAHKAGTDNRGANIVRIGSAKAVQTTAVRRVAAPVAVARRALGGKGRGRLLVLGEFRAAVVVRTDAALLAGQGLLLLGLLGLSFFEEVLEALAAALNV